MEQDIGAFEQETPDDDWPLDHHIEEILGCLTDVDRIHEIGSDAVDESFE